MKGILSELAALTLVVQHAIARPGPHDSAWTLRRMKTLVTFGDSYTDESRLGYFINHDGEAPPVGWIGPESNSTSTGGRIWPRYVNQYSGAELYNYAVSGAVCSNDVTPRTFSAISAPFPAVEQYEVPAFIADSQYKDPSSKKPVLSLPQHETVYSIWIGTNDLGNDAFLTDSQVKGKTFADYVECVYRGFDSLYKNGGRYFVLMNLAPLHLLPQYAPPEANGQEATQYWPNKGSNITEISYRIWENVVTLNEIFKYRTQAEVQLNHRYPGAQFALFDTNALLSDMYAHPDQYLNGTAPLNVESWVNQCDLDGQNCQEEPSPDSYLWYDPLHPSEQTTRIIARNFVDVAEGKSKYATYFLG